MSPVKLPYYPKVQATMRQTRFGVIEISHPTIYDKPLYNVDKYIIRVDTLECLRETIGDACFLDRGLLYSMLCGESKAINVNMIMASFYEKYPDFRVYVNERYYYCEETVPLYDNVVLSLREKINAYTKTTLDYLMGKGCKYLTQTHDFIYVAHPLKLDISGIKGAAYIC